MLQLKQYSEKELFEVVEKFNKLPKDAQDLLRIALSDILRIILNTDKIINSKRFLKSKAVLLKFISWKYEDLIKFGVSESCYRVVWAQPAYKYIIGMGFEITPEIMVSVFDGMTDDREDRLKRRRKVAKRYYDKNQNLMAAKARNYQAERRAKIRALKEASEQSQAEALASIETQNQTPQEPQNESQEIHSERPTSSINIVSRMLGKT